MAIKIPSKNIYSKQNPKIRDNIIERIEVGAVEVVPDNEYETPVYNYKKTGQPDILKDFGMDDTVSKDFPTPATIKYIATYGASKFYYSYFTILINPLLKNKYISYIFNWINPKEENNEQDNKQINGVSYSLFGKKIFTPIEADFVFADWGDSGYSKNLVYGEPVEEESTNISFPKFNSSSIDGEYFGDLGMTDETNISVELQTDGTYKISCNILSGMDYERASGATTTGNYVAPSDIKITGSRVQYKINQIEITVYGNTIGIDLQDKTVYINGETAKKVHSVVGNELMQTSNYILDENGTKTNSLDKMYGNTQKTYENGKETATLLCDVSDYFDFESGKKLIAIDNSTNKMLFKEYDRVIPMVYGADGKDRPMSVKKDGTPKEFTILGTKIIYDGAVWQELYLQES